MKLAQAVNNWKHNWITQLATGSSGKKWSPLLFKWLLQKYEKYKEKSPSPFLFFSSSIDVMMIFSVLFMWVSYNVIIFKTRIAKKNGI